MIVKLLGFILPLGLDTFAVALAVLGGPGLTRAQRLRATILIVAFEAGMPLVGLALGSPAAHLAGGAAPVVVPFVLAGVGIWMLRVDEGDDADDHDDEAVKARALVCARGFAVIGLGLGISLDELAVGFSIGLTRLPAVAVVAAIAVQALLAIKVGGYVGTRVTSMAVNVAEMVTTGPAEPPPYRRPAPAGVGPGDAGAVAGIAGPDLERRAERVREGSERLAGLALIILAVFMLIEALTTVF